jgi:hypothetical protein
MSDDTEVAALRARLEAIVKEAEDAEVQATAVHHHIQAARLLLEEESKTTALEQTTYSCPSACAIFIFIVVFSGCGLVDDPHRLFDL